MDFYHIIKNKASVSKTLVEELKLQEEERREAVKKITEAFLKSKRSVDEVLDYLKGKADL